MAVVLHRIGERPLGDLVDGYVELIRLVASGAGQISILAAGLFSGSDNAELEGSHPLDSSPDLEYISQFNLYE